MKVKLSRFMRILWVPHSFSKQDCTSHSTLHSAHPLMRMAVFRLSFTPPPCLQAPGEACSHTGVKQRKPGSQASVTWDSWNGFGCERWVLPQHSLEGPCRAAKPSTGTATEWWHVPGYYSEICFFATLGAQQLDKSKFSWEGWPACIQQCSL